MTTIHLLYPSLEYSLNYPDDTNYVILIKRKKIIKTILFDCCPFPMVIDSIIFNYTGDKISKQVYVGVRDRYEKNACVSIDMIPNIYISIPPSLEYDLHIGEYYHDCNEFTLNGNYTFNYIHAINTFMKEKYNKNNYIDCQIPNNDTVFMKNNAIVCMGYCNITALRIINQRKFTYLIVILKCIIKGLLRYFKDNNIEKYIKKYIIIMNKN